MKQLRQQQGFTMIELIMVIVILGVLSAFALPRFADLGGSARAAAVEGLGGNIKSAVGISRAQFYAAGDSAATTITLDGAVIALTSGYPSATAGTSVDVTGIISAAGLADNNATDAATYVDGDFTYAYDSTDIIQIYHTTAGAAITGNDPTTIDCGIVYDLTSGTPDITVDSSGC